MTDSRIHLDGIPIDAIDQRLFLDHIESAIVAGHGGLVVTPNLDHLRRTRKDQTWRDVLNNADLVVADGIPLLWAARLQGTPLPSRLAGIDLVDAIAGHSAARGWSLSLIGGLPGAADATAAALRLRHPGLLISGSHCPALGFEKDLSAFERLRSDLIAQAPQIVLIGLGSPKQELLAIRLRQTLPAAWFIGVGIAFSVLGGQLSRAPRWMQANGLEWLHRLAQEPRRLAWRYTLCSVYGSGLLARSALRRLGARS